MGIQMYLRHLATLVESYVIKNLAPLLQTFLVNFKNIFGNSLFSSKNLGFKNQHVIIDLCIKETRWF